MSSKRRHNNQPAKPKSSKQEVTFHESLPMAAAPMAMPGLDDDLRLGWQEVWQYGRVLSSATTSFGLAVGLDLGHYGQLAVRRITGRTARRLYLSLIVAGGITLTAIGTYLGVSTLNLYGSDITSPAALIAKKDTGITLLDRNGQVLFRGYGAANRQTVDSSQMPSNLTNATISAEDPHFYDHPGFSWQSTARAVYVDVTHGGAVEGGSTITQQLVKNALLSSNKTLQRKFQELLLSVELERRYSKGQILDMYLNEVYYGEGSYGVGAAAQTYFHKTVNQLTLGETATLAGLPLGPSRFDPVTHHDDAVARRDYVLDRMVTFGKITTAQATAAKAEPLVVFPESVQIQAPHFVFYVLDQLRAQFGDDAVEQGGMTVTTSLDLTKQNQAQAIVTNQINKLGSHHVTNGGLIALNPTTGDIISMVGSANYNDPNAGSYNVTTANLQPGSSFKPFAYVTAFEKGWTGATHVDDAPFSAPSGDGTNYVPQNYDLKFHGSVSLRHALDNSLNIPAVKVLQFATIPSTLQTAHSLGITTLNDPNSYGLSLVLGSGDVKPIEMAAAYGGFDTGGLKVTPRAILQVNDRTGHEIFKATAPEQPRVLDARYAYMITNILSDNAARLPEFPLNSPLKLSRPAAAKTGTTNDFRDNWTVGYTPDLVTAVWVGNDDHTPMQGVDGITGAAPIWHDYMEAALSGTPVHIFVAPAGIVTLPVCSDGGLAQPGAPSVGQEVFLADALPTARCYAPAPAPTPTPTPSPAPAGDSAPPTSTSPTPTPSTPPPNQPPSPPNQGGN